MKTILGISVGLAAGLAVTLLAQAPVNPGGGPVGAKGAPKAGPAKPAGEVLFGSECAMCHVAGEATRAPALETLRQLPADAVLTALTTGRMSAQAQRLSPADRIAVAEFVTGKTVSTAQTAAGGQCDAKSQGSAAGLTAGLNSKDSWNGWGGTPVGNRFTENGGIQAADVPRLRLAWAFGFPRALSVRTQPTVVGDWLFTASETGDVFALDAKSGCTRWTFQAKAGVRGALSVTALGSGKFGVYFGDQQANAYGLDALTGKQLWTVKVESHPNAAVTAAPVVYDGRVYVPVSAVGEESRGQDPNYACCSFRGSVSSIDVRTGELRWKSYTIPQEPAPRGKSSTGVELLGPAGAGVWGEPTLDAKRGLLYVGTGNGYAGPPQKEMNAVIAIDLKTGAHKWVQQTVPNDVWLMQCQSQAPLKDKQATGKQVNPNCPDEEGPDFDFSAAPLITTTAAGRDLIVIPQKSGVIWALDPDKGGEVVWQYRYGKGSGLGGQWGAAADRVNAYIGTGDGLSPTAGGMHAVNLETGKSVWSVAPQPKLCGTARGCSSSQAAAISAIPGAVFSAGADGGLRAYASADGSIIWTFDTNRPFKTVNGIDANGGTMDSTGAVVSGGMLYVNSGYGGLVGRAGNVLLAFRPE